MGMVQKVAQVVKFKCTAIGHPLKASEDPGVCVKWWHPTSPILSTVPTSWAAPLLAALWLWPGNMDVQSQYVSVRLGFPVIPRHLLERMQRWEFSQLIPSVKERS